MDKLLEMRAKELNRLEVRQRVSRKQMSQPEAGRMLSLSVRQIKRLLKEGLEFTEDEIPGMWANAGACEPGGEGQAQTLG